MFDSHKEILNALFEVYYDLATMYVKKDYFQIIDLQEKAKLKVRQKYGLDEIESGNSDAKELLNSIRKT